MDEPRWIKLKQIVADALEDGTDPVAWIENAVSEDPELRDEALQLVGLASSSGIGGERWDARRFLDQHITRSTLVPGVVLGDRFRIMNLLGSGGMGDVYEVWDQDLACRIAIKTVREDIISDSMVDLFRAELRKAREIHHPNICAVYEWHSVFLEHGRRVYFFTMEYLAGETMASMIARRIILTPEVLESLVVETAQGLAAAHRVGIVHRDLKPANIMCVEKNGGLHAVILDFGLARPPEAIDSREALNGTPRYMAPEQKLGSVLSCATDIFAFGLILRELLAMVGEAESNTIAGYRMRWRRLISTCLQPDPRARFNSADDLLTRLERTSVARFRARVAYGAVAGVLLAGIGIAAMRPRTAKMEAPAAPVRLTAHGSLTDSGTISSDGKWLAYSSDFGGGNKDIFVDLMGRGAPVRLTNDPAEDWQPDISPDATSIVFRSERDGGGIYEVPISGGKQRLVAQSGRNPKYSPDGSKVLFEVSRSGATSHDDAAVFVVNRNGGKPAQVCPEFADAEMPVWTSKGQRIIFYGVPRMTESSDLVGDWWISTLDCKATRTGAVAMLGSAKVRGGVPFTVWRDRLIFSANESDTTNLWQIHLSDRGLADGPAERVTYGAVEELSPAVSQSGTLVFTEMRGETRLWEFPLQAPARIEPVSIGGTKDTSPVLSADGAMMAFRRNSGGIRRIWIHSFHEGREWPVSEPGLDTIRPVLSQTGALVAWSVPGKTDYSVRVSETATPRVRVLCADCGQPFDFTSNARELLAGTGRDGRLVLVPLDGSPITKVFNVDGQVLSAQFSKKGDAMLLSTQEPGGMNTVAIAGLVDGSLTSRKEWRILAHERSWTARAVWSADQREVFYISARDGFPCLWRQAVMNGTYQPVGAPRPLKHFHETSFSLNAVSPLSFSLGIGTDRVVLPVTRATAEIWSASLR